MPNRPKALKLHKLAGNEATVKHVRVVEYTPIEEFPEPPTVLGEHGQKLWRDFGREMTGAGVVQALDLYALTELAVMWERFMHDAQCGVRTVAADLTAMRLMFTEFGATPAARRRVEPGESTKRENAFGKFKPHIVA